MPEFNNSRSRSRPLSVQKGSWKAVSGQTGTAPYGGGPFNTVTQNAGGDYKHSGTQFTESEGHPFSSRKGIEDVGGPFFTQKRTMSGIKPVTVSCGQDLGFRDYAAYYNYKGPLLPIPPDSNGVLPFPTSFESSDDDLIEMGTSAIAQANPENAIVNLSTTLGEVLKDGVPSLIGSTLWQDRIKTAQKAGSEYLNVQFGWLPLVSDIRKFADVMSRADAVLRQYERDAGKPVRRRVDISSKSTEEEVFTSPGAYPYAYGSGGNFLATGGGDLTLRRSITQRSWFSGSFVYHLPKGYDSRSELDRYALLGNRLGLNPSPDVLWDLAPWSWAIDWFSNAGDVVKNVSSFSIDGTVLAYAYVMETTIVRDTYTLEGCRDRSNNLIRIPPLTLSTETKTRVGANPYGFGVSFDSLSGFQASILAALGLSQSRR